jgi:hypothetical protein
MNGHTNARLKLAAALSLVVALAGVWAAARAGASAQEGQAQANVNQEAKPGPQSQAAQPAQQPPQENPIITELRKRIAGQEDRPAGEVFKNIQVLKTVTAGRLLSAMGGYTRALGVRCDFCHVPGEWEKDDKETKPIARDMMRMNGVINTELKKIKGLEADRPSVNCSTCHRGQPKPGADRPRPSQTPAEKPLQ